MKSPFATGSLRIAFHPAPFTSIPRLLADSASLYLRNFVWIAGLTLAVFLPAKLVIQMVLALLEVPINGTATYIVLDLSDLVLSSLVTPALIYALVVHLGGKSLPKMSEALKWGRRQWGKTLWNRFKAEITIMLWMALLVIPGILKMVELALVDPIVAIEADEESEVLARSRQLTNGHRRRILGVVAPLLIVELAGSYFVLQAFHGATTSRLLLATVDSLLSVGGQWSAVVSLLLYLGVKR